MIGVGLSRVAAMYEIPKISNLEGDTSIVFAVPEVPITGDQVEEVTEEVLDTSFVGIDEDRTAGLALVAEITDEPAEEAASAGLNATYALTFVQGEDGLSVGPSVLLSGTATREQWSKVFSSPAKVEGPLNITLSPSYLDELYASNAPETSRSHSEADMEEVHLAPSQHVETDSLQGGIQDAVAPAAIRPMPAVQRPPGGLREEIRRLSDAIEEQEGIDTAELLSEGYELALPLLRSTMSSTEIAEQLGLVGKDISTQVSGLARRVLTQLTREAPQQIVKSLQSEPSIGVQLQGLAKQAGITLSEIRAEHGISVWSLERLFLGKERINDKAFGAVILTLINRGVVSQEDATKLASKYFAEQRAKSGRVDKD